MQFTPELDRKVLIGQQNTDPFIQQLKIFIEHKKLPQLRYRNIIKRFGPHAFLKDGLVMINLLREGFQTRQVVVLPGARQAEIVATAHNDRLGMHH